MHGLHGLHGRYPLSHTELLMKLLLLLLPAVLLLLLLPLVHVLRLPHAVPRRQPMWP